MYTLPALRIQRKCLLYYQGGLAVGAVLFFFTFLDNYLVIQNIATSPVGWMLPYFALAAPIFIQKKLRFPSRSLLLWCMSYITVAVFSYLWSSAKDESFEVFIERVFASLFLLITVFLLAHPQVLKWAKAALIVATLIGVLNNFYQYVNPLAFLGLVDGRVSGFYMDPNDCSYALTLGMIFTVDLLPQKFRIPWVLIVGLGVALTFSRGGGLIWIITVAAMYFTRILDHKQSRLWILGFGTLLLSLQFLGYADGSDHLSWLANEGLVERVEGIIHGETFNDPSALERVGIMEKAWQMFLERPWVGQGIGSTSNFNITGFTVSTHNMHLLYAAEYGVLGLLILPLLLYISIYQASGETRKIAIVFTLFILLASMFAHTVLDQRSYLVGFAIMTVMSTMPSPARSL
jgi:O-antigen ligase